MYRQISILIEQINETKASVQLPIYLRKLIFHCRVLKLLAYEIAVKTCKAENPVKARSHIMNLHKSQIPASHLIFVKVVHFDIKTFDLTFWSGNKRLR